MSIKKEPVKQVSGSRKNTYRLGQIIILAGVAVFLYGLLSKSFDATDITSVQSFFQRKILCHIGGVICILAGFFMMKVGRYGKAGSGLVLDPEQERLDKEPINRSIGGQLGDMLDEAGIGSFGGRKEVIKVRCPHCKALNDEADQFCGQCGKALV